MRAEFLATNRDATISARIITLIEAFLRSRGIAFEAICRTVGLEITWQSDRNVAVPLRTVLALMEAGAAACDDEAFGLNLAVANPQELYSLLEYIVLNSPTVGDAIYARIRFVRLVQNAFTTDYIDTPEGARYVWRFPNEAEPRRQFIGFVTAPLAERIRRMTSSDWRPLEVTIEHAEPSCRQAYEKILGPNLRFCSAPTSMLIDRGTLSRQNPAADPALYVEVESYARYLLGLKPAGRDIRDKVADLIARRLSTDSVSEQAIARSLDISVRQLQRELAQHGTTFRSLVDQTRIEMARHFLVDTPMPLTEVAFVLGFSELSSFSRAARQWFGKSPLEVRKAQSLARPASTQRSRGIRRTKP